MGKWGKREPILQECPPQIPVSTEHQTIVDGSRAQERRAFAVKWRAAGYTHKAIAEAMGVSLSRVAQICKSEEIKNGR